MLFSHNRVVQMDGFLCSSSRYRVLYRFRIHISVVGVRREGVVCVTWVWVRGISWHEWDLYDHTVVDVDFLHHLTRLMRPSCLETSFALSLSLSMPQFAAQLPHPCMAVTRMSHDPSGVSHNTSEMYVWVHVYTTHKATWVSCLSQDTSEIYVIIL